MSSAPRLHPSLLLSAGLALLIGLAPLSLTAFAQQPEAAAEDAAEEAPAAKPDPARRPAPPRPTPRPAPAKPPARPPQAQAQPPAQPQGQAQIQALSVGQPPNATLPNGASTINESYGDWTVDCRINDGQKLCVLSQSQGNSQTNQRLFAIELRTPKDGRTDGTILMPFGLRLENGAILRLDDKDLGQGLRFSTCVPAGCLLPLSFPTVATDAMKGGKTLTAAALNLSSGDPVAFNISLNGFSAAFARIGQLGN